jgi:hypothetical protein
MLDATDWHGLVSEPSCGWRKARFWSREGNDHAQPPCVVRRGLAVANVWKRFSMLDGFAVDSRSFFELG